MTLFFDDLIAQIEVFDSLELEAAREYGIMENELTNPGFKELVGKIRIDELYHSKMCREVIDYLNQVG